MTDLTEKWKKGELPDGFYYVKDGENIIAEYLDGYFYNNGQPMMSFSGGVDEVLAPVPSYDEWKKAYECVVSENEEITTFKKLMKECREHLITYKKDNIDKGYVVYDGSYLINKINQALGEDK